MLHACEVLRSSRIKCFFFLRESEESFPDRLESSDLVKQLRESNHEMSDELAEKKQSLKLLQQRMNDMKKTFQKELNTGEPSLHK